ncbi:formimidoylglutamase [Virgibacillus soli]|uniref:Formimidoylglutamase n=1 Tax=Paracerasibacillus soli TaxID=480284 RepID=A0ABU5CT63_9BACI|nr:formimidoylglutamase [Virgibacillus soli]MDY0409558.1 formimidoylglutamase [Virgibacillus soli]
MTEIRHLRPAGKAIFKDRYTMRAKELLTPWSKGNKGMYGLVGLPLSKPSISHSGASFAPGTIREALQSYSIYSGEMDTELTEEILDFGDLYMDPTDVIGNHTRLFEGMTDIVKTKAVENWFMLGGDHSISYASIRAFKEAGYTVGVIQFDAHHDLRNTEDGGPTNGTPFRRLLEEGILQGKHLVQIGIRDFTNAKAYRDYALSQGITIYNMDAVYQLSTHTWMGESMQKLADKVDFIYLSVDVDVLDQAFAPGCPAIGPGGMDSRTLLESIYIASQHEKVKAMDIVEIDPTIDFRNMTSRVAAYLLLQFMKGKAKKAK